MEVYIEYVIADNLIIDYIIIYSVYLARRQKTVNLRILLSALIGTAFSVVLPLFRLNGVWLILSKVATSLVICAVAFGGRKYLNFLLLFYAFSFLMGGAAFGLIMLVGASFERLDSLYYIYDFPIGLIVLAIFLFCIFVNRLYVYVRNSRAKTAYSYKIEIIIGGKSSTVLFAYLDSGNLLFDYDDAPIVLVNKEALFGGELTDVATDELRYRLFDGQSREIKLVTADKLLIYDENDVHIIENVRLGLVGGKKFFDEYDALLNPLLFY